MHIFSDSLWTGDVLIRKSITGYVVLAARDDCLDF